MIGIFDENEIFLNVTICPRHRDLFGLRWRSNRKTCSIPNSWAAHRTTYAKGERGITLAQSRRLFKATEIVMPVGSSKFREISHYSHTLVMDNIFQDVNFRELRANSVISGSGVGLGVEAVLNGGTVQILTRYFSRGRLYFTL